MRRWIPIALLGTLLAGCQMVAPGPSPERIDVIDAGRPSPGTPGRVPRQVPFPEAEYAALAKSGSAVISGRLSLDGQAGANRPVAVAPVTTYSAEAAEQALAGRAVEPADPRARAYTHTTRTDVEGRFRLSGLPAGEFYVSGSMLDPSSGEPRLILRQVSLAEGEHREVTLGR